MADVTRTKHNTINNNKLKIFTINVNGLNQSNKRAKIFNYLKTNKIEITLPQETHSTKDTEKNWQKEWPGMSFWHTGPTHQPARQAILFAELFQGKIQNI